MFNSHVHCSLLPSSLFMLTHSHGSDIFEIWTIHIRHMYIIICTMNDDVSLLFFLNFTSVLSTNCILSSLKCFWNAILISLCPSLSIILQKHLKCKIEAHICKLKQGKKKLTSVRWNYEVKMCQHYYEMWV